MFRDKELGTGEDRHFCGDAENEPIAAAAGEDSAHPANVIDFRRASSNLRMKSTFTGFVSSMDAASAGALAEMYLNGEGVVRDPSKAARFLAIAAKGGIPQCMHQLAQLHLEGVHVPHDAEYAIRLLQEASDSEHVPSTVLLAEVYIFGQHCPRDVEMGLDLLYGVVYANDPAVFYYLAYVYDKFREYRDLHEAAYWYRRAAEHGHYKSQIRLASLYATGDGVPRCRVTAEAFLDVAMESTTPQDPKLLYWQGERLAARPETTFMAEALIKAAAAMQYPPAQRMMLQQGWR